MVKFMVKSINSLTSIFHPESQPVWMIVVLLHLRNKEGALTNCEKEGARGNLTEFFSFHY